MASRTNPGRSKVSIVGKVPSRACEAPVGRARVNSSILKGFLAAFILNQKKGQRRLAC